MAAGAALLAGPAVRGAAGAEPVVTPQVPKAKILKLFSGKAGVWEDWVRPGDRPWLNTEPAAIEKHLVRLAERLRGVEFVGPDRPLDTKQALELEPVGPALTPTNYQPIGACAGLHHVACLGNRVRDLQDLCTLMGLKHHADWA